MNLKDNEILGGILNGDKVVFDLVFKNYYAGLYTLAMDYLRSSEASKEIVQEIFLYLWENHEKIQIKTSLKAYLYRSVHNRCMNYIRDNISRSHKEIQIEELKKRADILIFEIQDTIFDKAFNEQIEQEFEEAIDSLPEQCKTIFRLNRFDNLSYAEIANQLKVSISTVKTQMFRAMNSLRQKMNKYL